MSTLSSEHPTPVEMVHSASRIPVRNIWLLMLYASDLMREREFAFVDSDDNIDKLPDLIAELLCRRVEERLLRNLSPGYRPREDVLNRVRGRIDHIKTVTRHLQERGQVACRFEELTVNTPRNRYVRTALEVIAGIVSDRKLRKRCMKLALRLRQLGVTGVKSQGYSVGYERLGIFDKQDRPMLATAELALNLKIPTERTGRYVLTMPEREIHWLRRLYEKAVAGFFATVLKNSDWTVSAGKYLKWPIQQKTSGIDSLFPSMKTDIILENKDINRRIIIDTKFNALVVSGWYREETVRNAYIYQIFSYLRSQDGQGDKLADSAFGVLLHPSVGRTIDETVKICGHEIRFKTIDLCGSPSDIRRELLTIPKRLH